MERLRSASLITAIKTPYTPSGDIDLETYDQLIKDQIKHGVEGVIVGGTTGEGHLMSWDEQVMLIAHSVHSYGSELFVVGNTGSNNTREALHATHQGFAVGMHASLQINPYYGKTSAAGMLTHLGRALNLGPAYIYNVPARTSQDIPDEIMIELAKSPNMIGVKECTGNERIQRYEENGIACWSGNDDEASAGRHKHGSHGVISVTSNLVPGLMRKLMDNLDADLEARLAPLMNWLFSEPNPIAINTILAMTGAAKPVFRLPYVPLDAAGRARGIEVLKAFAAEEIVGHVPTELADDDFILV